MKRYIFKFKGLFALNIIAIILSACLTVSVAYILKIIVEAGTSKDIYKLKGAAIVSILFLIVGSFVSFAQKALRAKFIQKSLTAIKVDIFSKIINMNIKTFKEENSASYISTLTNDIKILEDDYFDNILQSFYQIASFILASISLTIINPIMTVTVFIGGILPISVPLIFNKKLSTMKKTYSNDLSIFTAKVKDMLTGFEVIKSFNIGNKIENDYKNISNKSEKSKFKFNLFNAVINAISDLLGSFLFIGIMLLGVYLVIKDKMTIGSMIAATQLMNNVLNPLMILSERLSKFKSVKSIEEKVKNIIEINSQGDHGIEKLEFNSNISFENLNFDYGNERKILRGATFTIEKGSKYAIVGASGSGKSTILKLLLRYYENYMGNIEIDGIRNKDIKMSSLYSLISIIHQDIFMFDDSIKHNISLYGQYSEDEINNAIEKSGLINLVTSLKEGSYSLVGENGCNLSGGEQQRIAIARALIKKTPILVLDEATSSLDNETAYNIEKSILAINDLTCLVITHKLNEDILNKYDSIIVLKEGKVVENGSFYELIEKKQYFYSLYNVMLKEE